MHSRETVERVLTLSAPGRTSREIARLTGVAERTVAHWRRGDRRRSRSSTTSPRCPRCGDAPLRAASYAYLLGMYLGDGHITTGQRTRCLWIYCADSWPGVRREVAAAMPEVLADVSVSVVQRTGCVAVKSFSTHWACLFPQHGPGLKHTRPIVLEPWQQDVVDRHTEPFLRGLFHSDGCRITNWTRRRVAGEMKRYEYPRYFFSNTSTDILDLCAAGLERLGIAHTRPRVDAISVARREAVAALDVFVGPKT